MKGMNNLLGVRFKLVVGEDGKVKICTDTDNSGSVKKTREFKGHNVNKYVSDYCVVDIETTGINLEIDEIIEISAIKVRDNAVVSEYSTLIKPDNSIPYEATRVNHITDDMVKDAPKLDMVIDDFLEFIGNDVIVGYNNARFDMNFLYDDVGRLKNKHFSNDYIDMLYVVRRALPDLENSKLETVSKYYGFNTDGEHRALKDCYLTKLCYDKLHENFGESIFHGRSHYSFGNGIQYSSETIALRELSELISNVLHNDTMTIGDLQSMYTWTENHKSLSDVYPFSNVFEMLDIIFEKGEITEQEIMRLQALFEDIIDPVKSQSSDENFETLDGKHICITGDFDYGLRKDVEQLIMSAGGVMDKGVKKTTDYVAVGSKGSAAWKTGNYGSKIQKAMELKNKGIDIKIVEENEFIPRVLQLIKGR